MNNIYDFYESITQSRFTRREIDESILDNDDDVRSTANKRLLSPENLSAVIKNCTKEISLGNIKIKDDNNLELDQYSYIAHRSGIYIDHDFPDYIQFDKFPSDPIDIIVNNFDVTTLRGLPEDLSNVTIKLLGCSNFKDFGRIKQCKSIIIKNTPDVPFDIKQIKHFPKAKFIRLIGFPDLDEKTVSRITGFPKNKITIL